MGNLGEIKTMGDNIVRTHDGQTWFNLTEARKIMGIGENTVARKFHEAGILVKKVGISKRVSAYDIAECMLFDRRSPIR